MKNITVSVADEVYRRARMKAAERGTSVSALVRDFLENLDFDKQDFERRRELQDAVLATIETFRAKDRLRRAEVHNRNALR